MISGGGGRGRGRVDLKEGAKKARKERLKGGRVMFTCTAIKKKNQNKIIKLEFRLWNYEKHLS